MTAMKRTLAAITLLLLALALTPSAEAAYTRPATFVIPPSYQEARDFHEGLAAVKSGDRWGYVDYLGRIAIPFVHRVPEAGDFSEGFAFVGDHYIHSRRAWPQYRLRGSGGIST